jgi:hypothetical protein
LTIKGILAKRNFCESGAFKFYQEYPMKKGGEMQGKSINFVLVDDVTV